MEKRLMQCYATEDDVSQRPAVKACLLSGALLLFWITGCGSGTTSSTPPPPTSPQGPQTYFAPFVAGTTSNATIGGAAGGSIQAVPLQGPQTYAIDDSAKTFSQTTYEVTPPVGPQVLNSGMFTGSSRGLLSLGTTANYVANGSTYIATTYPTPGEPGGFAVELAGQAGGLVQLVGQPVVPMVAAMQCPSSTTPQTYQFVTIPAALISASADTPLQPFTWSPTNQTAYGSVDISSSGSMVTFNNIHQFTLSGTGEPAQLPVTGGCAPTFFGNTISFPYPSIITNPGTGTPSSPSATVGIGPTGLLVEDNGNTGQYQTALGAGTGAVGLPKPSSALNTGALIGAQYLGFVYGAGIYPGHPNSPTGWSSHLASFGFSNVPSSCPSVPASTNPGALIYGGGFTNDDPTTSSNGFGNCDLAVDLGTQDPSNNGLYPNAIVWMFPSYAANTMKKTYSFSAIAIAGQLNGKYAIFLLGVDSAQPWAIYLLQSN